MNSINPDIQFTTETEYDFPPQNRLHTLDTDIWMSMDGTIMHSYYQKEMKTPLLLMRDSAMAGQQKFSILSNELMRRLGNIGRGVSHTEKLSIVETFIREMKNSGYERKAAREAVISGLKGFSKRQERRMRDGDSHYRSGQETLSERMRKKLLESTTWF